jgi:hypothetical protein
MCYTKKEHNLAMKKIKNEFRNRRKKLGLPMTVPVRSSKYDKQYWKQYVTIEMRHR